MAIDLYGKPFNFRMMHGYTTHRTLTGTCFSIILLVIALAFIGERLSTLINYGDTKLTTWSKDNGLPVDFQFRPSEFGGKIAVALVSNNWLFDTSNYNDPDYATLSIQHTTWGPGTLYPDELEMRSCNLSDFSTSKDDEQDDSSALVELYGIDKANHIIEHVIPNFICIDSEDTYLQGNWDTIWGSAITMLLNRCAVEERETCKSEEEYQDWIRDKMLLIFNS